MEKDPLDKWLYFLVIIMGVYFLIRIIDQAKLINIFPLVNNDLGSYVAQLHMLKVCGFHKLCPYWYNGFVTFLVSSPGWQFFAYPLYLFSSNILLITYVSSILMYIVGFLFIHQLGKNQKFSLTKRLAFFVLMFGNSINIGNFIFQGRMPSLNAAMLFLGLGAIVYFYKHHKIDKIFVLLFVPTNILIILSHYQEAVLAQILVLSLLLIKKSYEKLIVILSVILSLILSAFWWIPFLLSSLDPSKSSIITREQGKWFIYNIVPKFEFTTTFFTSLLVIVIPLALLILFYFYWHSRNKSKKELVFYSPVLILTVLFWLRLTAYIPLLEHISPDPFLISFLFFILVIFFKTDFNFYPKPLRIVTILFLTILPVANITVSHVKTPYFNTFEYGDVEKNTIALIELIEPNGKFVFASNLPSGAVRYNSYYYAYATIYNNLSTPEGYYYHIAPLDYRKGIHEITITDNCETIKMIMHKYTTNYSIAYGERCHLLKECEFEEIAKKENTCLYKI